MMMKLMARVFSLVASVLHLLPLKRRIVLMSRQSSKPSLDFKLLAAELERNHPDVEVRMCLSEPELASKTAFLSGTIKQLREASCAAVVVADGYIPAVCIPSKREGTSVVQMWHALGAIKKFGYQSVGTPAGRSFASAKAACMHKNYDEVIAGSAGSIQYFSEAFGYELEDIRHLGLPRIDYLVGDSPQSARRKAMARIRGEHPVFDNGKPTILYAPTLRKGAGYDGWLGKAVEELASRCDPARFNFVVAAHPLNNHIDDKVLARLGHVTLVHGASTINLLGLADGVITDYSAIALEAGILGKPVFFYVPDIDVYRLSPGLNMDPVALFPAVSSADAAVLMEALARHVDDAGNILGDPAFESMIKRDFAAVMDGRCSERIAAELCRLLDRN